jgi:hypothetical protein
MLPAALAAQSSVSGFVRDSLTGKPFIGANVQLVLSTTPWVAGLSTQTDSIGRYVIKAIPPGVYILGFTHPRLDSLGLDQVSRTIEVNKAIPALRADLALPSGRTFVTTLCGQRADSTGAVVGRVFSADDDIHLKGGSVVVRFAQMRLDGGGVRRVQRSVTAPFGGDGRYVACGIPTDASVLVQARAGALDSATKPALSGEIELTFEPKNPFLHRDLLIELRDTVTVTASATAPGTAAGITVKASGAPRIGSARIVGRVVSADGKGVIGARVTLQDTDISTVTDTAGSFRLAGAPAGTRTLEAIAIGFVPVRAVADLKPNRETAVTIAIGSKVTTLGTVKVVDAPTDRSGFAKRRAQGNGYFLDANQIEARGSMTVASALLLVPGLHGNGYDTQNPSRPNIAGRGNCKPTVYLDGQQLRDGLSGVDDMLTVRRVGGIEIYSNPGQAPAQYTGAGGGNCSTILVWTQSYTQTK